MGAATRGRIDDHLRILWLRRVGDRDELRLLRARRTAEAEQRAARGLEAAVFRDRCVHARGELGAKLRYVRNALELLARLLVDRVRPRLHLGRVVLEPAIWILDGNAVVGVLRDRMRGWSCGLLRD